jgi:hypothetical protein
MRISTTPGLVKNYEEMLSRLYKAAFFETLLLTIALRTVPPIDQAFTHLEAIAPIGLRITEFLSKYVPDLTPTNFHLAGLIIAVATAFLFRLFHLHNRISDIFGIRKKFDVDHILVPLAIGTGARHDPQRVCIFGNKQKELMGAVFYRYASSRSQNTLVDKHDIEQALDNWSWFWVMVEGIPLWLVGMMISANYKALSLIVLFFVLTLLYLILSAYFYNNAKKRIRSQLQAILRDGNAVTEIKSALDAV